MDTNRTKFNKRRQSFYDKIEKENKLKKIYQCRCCEFWNTEKEKCSEEFCFKNKK